MRLEVVLFVVVVALMACEASILLDDRSIDMNMDRDSHSTKNSYKRAKRGILYDSAKLVAKGGKYGAKFWQDYKVKRIFVGDAKPLGGGVYVKKGGQARALMDLNTFQRRVVVGDYQVFARDDKTTTETFKPILDKINWIGPTPKCSVLLKHGDGSSLAGNDELMVLYI